MRPVMMQESKESSLAHVSEILERMRIQETTTYCQATIEDDLVGLWRKMLVEWMYYVVDYCRLQRHTVAAAAFFFDVAVKRNLVETSEEHQLAAATALQLSLKTHDSSVIKLDKLVKLGRGLFSEQDVVDMEQKILDSTNWHLHPPSAYCFLRQYEQLLPTTVSETTKSMIDTVTGLACELTLADHNFLQYNPSEIAYASLLMALEMISHEDFPIVQRQCFMIRMSNIANIDSKSKSVLAIFEDLKESLDASPKLQKVIDSIANQRKQKEKAMRKSRTQSKSHLPFTESPRHVMVRLMSG